MDNRLSMTIRSTARSYLEIIFHRKWLLVVPVIFGTLIAWGYSYTVTPMFKSTAVVEVSDPATFERVPANIADGKVFFDVRFTPPFPAEHVTFRSILTNDYIEEVL